MKTVVTIIALVFGFLANAQSQTVTLTCDNFRSATYTFSTNQIITINSFIRHSGTSSNTAAIRFHNGPIVNIYSYLYGTPSNPNAVFTGVTNITLAEGVSAALAFTITTPTPQSMIPANAVVIPSDATGPVQIALESSSDLVNWTAALPGTYGNTHSNRFFRVRAIAQ